MRKRRAGRKSMKPAFNNLLVYFKKLMNDNLVHDKEFMENAKTQILLCERNSCYHIENPTEEDIRERKLLIRTIFWFRKRADSASFEIKLDPRHVSTSDEISEKIDHKFCKCMNIRVDKNWINIDWEFTI